MKKILVLLGVLTLSLPLVCQMGPHPQPFSADMSIKGGRGEMTGKYYFGDKKIRMDMNTPRGQMYNIMDVESQTTDMVMPEQKMYMEMKGMGGRGPAASAMKNLRSYDPNDPCKTFADHTCKNVGSDTVDGRACDKWEMTDKQSGETTTACIDKKLLFPLRMESKDTTIEFTHVKEGMPDASLFTVPSDYRKMDMGGMMGQRPPREPQE